MGSLIKSTVNFFKMWLRECWIGAPTALHISVYCLMILTCRESDYKQLPVGFDDVLKQSFAEKFKFMEWAPISICHSYLNCCGAWHFIYKYQGIIANVYMKASELSHQQWTWNREEKGDDFLKLSDWYMRSSETFCWVRKNMTTKKCEIALLIERKVTMGGNLTGTCLLGADIDQQRNCSFSIWSLE